MSKKLHILFLCGWYPSRVFHSNGDFIQRHAVAAALTNQVTVIHIVTDPNLKTQKEIESSNYEGLNQRIVYLNKSKNGLTKGIRFVQTYANLLKEIAPVDLIHLSPTLPFGLLALWSKFRKGIPFVITEHLTNYLANQPHTISWNEKQLAKLVVKHSQLVCPVSNNLGAAMQRHGLKNEYYPIPNVVDTNTFKPSQKNDNEFVLVHISSLDNEHKNIEGMLRAASRLEERIGSFTWKFIGGSSHQYQPLLNELNFSKAKIEFIPFLEHQKLIYHLQQASGFVLFSNYENLPCVILEAFACGVPVISSKVGGIDEYFPEGFGYLVEKGNELNLVEALVSLKNEPHATRQEMHTYTEEHFSYTTIGQEFSKMYKIALGISPKTDTK